MKARMNPAVRYPGLPINSQLSIINFFSVRVRE